MKNCSVCKGTGGDLERECWACNGNGIDTSFCIKCESKLTEQDIYKSRHDEPLCAKCYTNRNAEIENEL